MKGILFHSFIIFYAVMLLSACGRNTEASKIQQLEEEFRAADDPEEKSELANKLNKEYFLYYLSYPNDTTFFLNWAEMAYKGKEFEQAEWVLGKYIEVNQNNYRVYEKRGRINAILGYFKQAGNDFRKAAEISPAAAKNRLQDLAFSYRHADSVIHHADEKIKEGKEVDRFRLERAEELIEVQQLTAARNDIELVLEKGIDKSYSFYLMAELWLEANDVPRAEKSIGEYFKTADTKDSLYQQVLELQQHIAAEKKVSGITEKLGNKSYSDLVKEGTEIFNAKRFPEAKIYFTALISHYPDSIIGYLYRSQANIQTASLEEAMNDITRAIRINPENISAHNLKAYIHLLRKEYAKVDEEVAFIREQNGEPLEILIDKSKEK